MTDLDIVKENDNFRARLEYDESGEKPYDEGATPILSREFRSYGSRFEAVNDQADGFESLIGEVYNACPNNDPEEFVTRFLRIFVGSYSVEWDSSDNCRYVAFDTPEWREKVGLTDEYLDKVGTDVLDRSKLAEGSLSEILAWANGEVFGFIVEKRTKGWVVFEDEDREDEAFQRWEEVDACWGFFGRESAVEAAVESFDHYSDN